MSLSKRAQAMIAGTGSPSWPTDHTYHAENNLGGLIAPCYAINEPVAPELEEFTKRVHITQDAFKFHWSLNGGPHLPHALATHLNESFNPHIPIKPEHMVIGEGATSISEILAFALADGPGSGSGILCSRPIFGGYLLDYGLQAGVKICFADTDAEGSLDPVRSVEAFEKALGKYTDEGVDVRAVLIANPNNPLGRCYPRETLLALLQFCSKHNLHLISDEIFGATAQRLSGAPSSAPASNGVTAGIVTPMTSLLSIPLTSSSSDSTAAPLINPSQVHVVYGLAKDFGAPGLRIGALITQSNPQLIAAAKKMLRFHDVSGPSVQIATAMLEDREWCRAYLDRTRRGLRERYEYATRLLDEIEGVKYVRGGEAGFFVFVDLSAFLEQKDRDGERRLVDRMVQNGLFLAPGAESYGEVGWFRFVYTHEKGVVDQAVRRLRRALGL